MKDSPQWKSFEDAVAQIQGLFTPNATITRNARLKDRLGHTREYDVLIEDSWSGNKLLAVIECKDLKRKVGNPEVEAFKQKTDKIRANFRAIVSRNGFTKPALESAAHEGIGAMSLLPEDGNIAGLAIYAPVCADWWRWGRAEIRLRHKNRALVGPLKDIHDIRYNGKSVFGWFVGLLKQDFEKILKTGVLSFGVRFPNGIQFYIDAKPVSVSEAWLFVEREHLRKYKRLKITGNAFYDWHKGCLQWPNKGALVTEAIDREEIPHWDDYEGEFPALHTDADTNQGAVLFQIQMEVHDTLPDFGEDAAEIDSKLWTPIERSQ